MKRLTIALVLVLGVCFSGFSQEIDEKEKKQFKKTRVSTETLMGHGVDEYGAAKEIGTKKSTRLFDDQGNMTTLIEYNEKSQPISRNVFKYNKSNQQIGGLVYEGYDKLVDKYRVSYDKTGNKVRKQGMLDDKKYDIQFSYDAQGNLTEKTKYNQEDEKVYKYSYSYIGGKLMQEEYWSENFSLTKTFNYNEKGYLTEEKSRTDKFQGYTFEFTYDSLGNKTSEKKYTIDNLPYEWYDYTYTEGKNIKTIKKYDFMGVLTYKWVYLYNDKMNLESVKIYEADELIYITKYLYKYHPKPVKKP